MRANKKKSKIYRAVNQHSFSNLPVIPLEENYDLGPEEIDTSFTVTVSITTLPSIFFVCPCLFVIRTADWLCFWTKKF